MASKKDRTQKMCNEMEFREFCDWATGHMLFSIGEGKSLRDTMWMILEQSIRNPNFGVRDESGKS